MKDYLCITMTELNLIAPRAESYAADYSTAISVLLQEIAQYTELHHPKAHMLSGPLQGGFLRWISLLMQPRRILELGTFTGFSALCLAEGLAPDGVLHTIESRIEEVETAKAYFKRAPFGKQIILHHGNALDIIPALQEAWDLVFIDADKVNYLQYYQLILPRLRPGGIILADNVLFHGEVLETEPKGKNARAIQAFNEYLKNDQSVDKIMLTLRDGLFLIRKK
jgi:predicted O-methyltransferase YrrM